MSAAKWGGGESKKARAVCAPMVRQGVPCCRCGKPVVEGQAWHADHYPVSREFGGTQVWPAHERCNTRDGGKRGARITNARKTERQDVAVNRQGVSSERSRGIRGV